MPLETGGALLFQTPSHEDDIRVAIWLTESMHIDLRIYHLSLGDIRVYQPVFEYEAGLSALAFPGGYEIEGVGHTNLGQVAYRCSRFVASGYPEG